MLLHFINVFVSWPGQLLTQVAVAQLHTNSQISLAYSAINIQNDWVVTNHFATAVITNVCMYSLRVMAQIRSFIKETVSQFGAPFYHQYAMSRSQSFVALDKTPSVTRYSKFQLSFNCSVFQENMTEMLNDGSHRRQCMQHHTWVFSESS